MTRKFLDYIKTARLEATDTTNANPRDADSKRFEIQMTTDGYPIIPKLVMEKELKKAEWERLLWAFLTQYYCKWIFWLNVIWESEWCPADLASEKKLKQVSYSAMKTNTEAFIPNKYWASGIILQDPRNMHLDDIRKVLWHCYNCQAESRPESAFWFGKIIGAKRNYVFVNYPGSSNDQGKSWTKSRLIVVKRKRAKGNNRKIRNKEMSWSKIHIIVLKRRVKGDNRRNNCRNCWKSIRARKLQLRMKMKLKDHESQQAPKLNKPEHLPQEPLIDPSQSEDPLDNVDPALHAQDANQTAQQPDDNSHTGNKTPAPPEADPTMQNPSTFIQHSSNNHPATKLNHDVESLPNPICNIWLSTKGPANLSPQLLPQIQTTNKRKKLTADDWAALEAQEMVQSETRCRSKLTWGKWYLSCAESGISVVISVF